jgi:outer membrane protein OmpA-like peptidoglycan-associated protein
MTRIAVPSCVAAMAAILFALAQPALAQRSGLPLPPIPPASAPATNSSGATLPMPGPSIDPLAVPMSAPPPPVLPPPTVVPVRTERPPPPATVAADAPGAATTIPDGLQVTFGPGRAEMNPATYGALESMLSAARPDVDFSVRAYAAGDPSDPSVARRLSLSRALAVRSVLIRGGVASPRITVLALGAAPPTKPPGPSPDRVDITETEPK